MEIRKQQKIRNQTNTRESITLNQKACIETRVVNIGTHKHVNETTSNMLNTSVDKTSYTSSDYGFMRSVHRRNNSKKKTLIYIYLISHFTIA